MISGSARGHRLKVPKGWRVRPTADRVKESVFNLLRVEWETCRVLDLFAGSGALGIEALSRGAAEAVFVEADPRSVSVIRENLRSCGLEIRARVIRGDALRFLVARRGAGDFTLIFADPPYERGLARGCLERADRASWLALGGRMVVEHSRRESPPEHLTSLTLLDHRPYGDTRISIYIRANEANEA